MVNLAVAGLPNRIPCWQLYNKKSPTFYYTTCSAQLPRIDVVLYTSTWPLRRSSPGLSRPLPSVEVWQQPPSLPQRSSTTRAKLSAYSSALVLTVMIATDVPWRIVMTRFHLVVPLQSPDVTKKLMGQRMQIEGPQIKWKLTVWPRKWFSWSKYLKMALFLCTNLGFHTLEGLERPAVNSRSTSVVPLRFYRCDGSDEDGR